MKSNIFLALIGKTSFTVMENELKAILVELILYKIF